MDPYGNQQLRNHGNQQPIPTPRPRGSVSRPNLPRSISSTNIDKTEQCRQIIKQDWVPPAPQGGTNYFPTVPAFTLTLPNLDGYPSAFKQFVFEKLIDKMTQQSLEAERCLNWCASATSLVPLYTTGDGNCLMHAASLAMWGFQDKNHTLRNAVNTALQAHSSSVKALWRRWKYNKDIENRQMGIQLEERQWLEEWRIVVSQASLEAAHGQALESLDDFHVFVLSNILRRPIVLYAAPKIRSVATGGTLQHVNFHGIYLPLLWEPGACKKNPLPLGYYGGHFVALVAIDHPQGNHSNSFNLPLTDVHGQPLPVRYCLGMEEPTPLIMDYLHIKNISGHASPYIASHTIVSASLSIVDKPAYLKPLLDGFIDACSQAFQGGNKQPISIQPIQAHYNPAPNRLGQSYNQDYHAPPQAQPPASSYNQQPQYGNALEQREKCINNCGMFGNPSNGGLCSKCYQKHLNEHVDGQHGANNLTPKKCLNNCGNYVDYNDQIGLCFRCVDKSRGAEQNIVNQQQPQDQPHYGNQLNSEHSQPNYGNSVVQSGSIKCPHCSNPGHPNYLGMCETCYLRGNSGQEPPPQKQPDHIYEQIPGPPPQADPAERRQCQTTGCEFFGTAHTAYYCSRCFERDMEKILREADHQKLPPPPPAPNHPPVMVKQQQPLPPKPVEQFQQNVQNLQHPGRGPEKCPKCNVFFATEEYGGMCSTCFMEMTKKDQDPPKQPPYIPSNTPAYTPCKNPVCVNLAGPSGYCNACEVTSYRQTAPVTMANICLNQGCYGAPCRNGYCEDCNARTVVRPHAATAVLRPVPKPRRTSSPKKSTSPIAHLTNQMGGLGMADIECFVCSGSDGNTLCRRHAELARQKLLAPSDPPVTKPVISRHQISEYETMRSPQAMYQQVQPKAHYGNYPQGTQGGPRYNIPGNVSPGPQPTSTYGNQYPGQQQQQQQQQQQYNGQGYPHSTGHFDPNQGGAQYQVSNVIMLLCYY